MNYAKVQFTSDLYLPRTTQFYSQSLRFSDSKLVNLLTRYFSDAKIKNLAFAYDVITTTSIVYQNRTESRLKTQQLFDMKEFQYYEET